MQELLGGWGCSVHGARGLAQARETLRRAGAVPDGIIVDYHLDEGDGIEAILALRWHLGADLPAVLLRRSRSRVCREDAAAQGDSSCSTKPLKTGCAARRCSPAWHTRPQCSE